MSYILLREKAVKSLTALESAKTVLQTELESTNEIIELIGKFYHETYKTGTKEEKESITNQYNKIRLAIQRNKSELRGLDKEIENFRKLTKLLIDQNVDQNKLISIERYINEIWREIEKDIEDIKAKDIQQDSRIDKNTEIIKEMKEDIHSLQQMIIKIHNQVNPEKSLPKKIIDIGVKYGPAIISVIAAA